MRDDDILMGDLPPSLKSIGGFLGEDYEKDAEEFQEWFAREILIEVPIDNIEQAMIVKQEWQDVWIEARSSLRRKMEKGNRRGK